MTSSDDEDLQGPKLPIEKHSDSAVDQLLRRYRQKERRRENCCKRGTYGIPSLSIPCGFTQDGLPVGLMICGPHFTDSKIFALAAAYEEATQWHLKKPPLSPDTPVPPLLTHL